eukprot:maker-scaffold_20-snap-gene-3.45-mRNA-1 protein AED:0.04 eAED:0.04 QI:852/1/1/1/0.71/0.5/8/79/332
MSYDLEKFEVGVTLGTGSFGRVRFCKFKSDLSRCCAIKYLKKHEVVKLNQVEHIIAEKSILESISRGTGEIKAHPFMVNLLGTFQDAKFLYMIMDYVNGGEFFTCLRKEGRLDSKKARFYAGCVVLMFEHLHGADIVYRDLKPENLLLDHQGYLKLTDFGFAKKVIYKTYTLCGTPEYIAPEVLLNKGHGKGVDWWTFGILAYEMLAGQPPFIDDEDPMGIYQQVLAGHVHFPRFFDRASKNLIKKILVADLTKRFGCLRNGPKDIKTHKWFSGFSFEKLLAKETPPPIVPSVSGADDTSNFDSYPDSPEEPADFSEDPNPFADFDCVVVEP